MALLLGTLAGCSGGSDGTGVGSGASDPPTGAVQVRHRFGTTVVERAPRRVVTVGLTDQDPVLALGVRPVGINDWFGDHPYAVWPWARDLLGDARPEIIGSTTGIDFERIAALRPDVIFALYAGLEPGEYDKLSQIAPTVSAPKRYDDFTIPWQEQTRIVGRVLRREAREELVRDVEQRFVDARAAHPEFDGATGLVVSPGLDAVSVYATRDARGRFLAELGFRQPAEIDRLAGDGFSVDLSYERTDLLDVDAVVWILNDIEADRQRMEDEPLYRTLPVHEEGREVFVANESELGGATSFVTVLSVPVLLDGLVPKLATAMRGNGE